MGNCFRSLSTEKSSAPAASPPSTVQPTASKLHETTDNKEISSIPQITERACFGAGCYWGTEKYFAIDFGRKMYPESIIRGKVGFMGPKGAKVNPSYEEVCSGLLIYSFFEVENLILFRYNWAC
jgi:hypothetical protein